MIADLIKIICKWLSIVMIPVFFFSALLSIKLSSPFEGIFYFLGCLVCMKIYETLEGV